MSIFKIESIPGRSVFRGFFLLILAALAVSGCAKESSGVGNATGAQSKTEQTGAVKADAAKTDAKKAEGIQVKVGDPVAGKAVYEKYCHFCHGTKAMGDGPIGIAIKPSPADLIHDRYRVLKTDKQLFYSISEGVRRTNATEMEMPRWKDVLTEQQRWDVLAYIRQLENKYSSKDLLKQRDDSR